MRSKVSERHKELASSHEPIAESQKSIFQAGGVVEPPLFVGREGLLQGTLADLRQGRSVILLGPRRMGKTSLLYNIRQKLSQDFVMLFLDCRTASTLEGFYNALIGAALSQAHCSAQIVKTYAFLANLGGRLSQLAYAYQANKEAPVHLPGALVKQLYAFVEHVKAWEAPEASLHVQQESAAVDGFIADAAELCARSDSEEAVLLLQHVLEQLAQLPRERFFERLVGAKTPLKEEIIPLLRFKSGELSEVDLMHHLFATLEAMGRHRRLVLLLDEVQTLRDEKSLFAALQEVMSRRKLSFVLCADGVGGKLLEIVREIGPAKRHPFLKLAEEDKVATVKYVGPLSPEETARFVEERLRLFELSATEEALARLYERTGGIPYYVQYLGQLCVEEAHVASANQITPKAVEAAFVRLLQEKDPDFAVLLEALAPCERTTLLQTCAKKVWDLRDIAGELETSSEELVLALEGLAEKLMIEQVTDGAWRMTDEVFRAWLCGALGHLRFGHLVPDR